MGIPLQSWKLDIRFATGRYVREPTPEPDRHPRRDLRLRDRGGGISGLAAALIFQRQAGPGKTCLVLDNHPIFGGEAKRNEFLVDGHRLVAHQGSAFYPVPYPRSFIGCFYESIGLKTPRLEYQKWAVPRRSCRLAAPHISVRRRMAFTSASSSARHRDYG